MTQPRPDRASMPYRDCVGLAVFSRDGHVFLGRRTPKDDPENSVEWHAPWQMPQGGIDPGEMPLQAAMRELFEETGIRSVKLVAEAPDWIFYDLPDEVLGIALKGRYRGQRQRWFAFAFTGSEDEIDVLHPAGGTAPAEFDTWRWAELAEVPEVVVPFKRQAYERVVAAFAQIPASVRGTALQ